jgi:hypothetical protein
MSRHARIAAAVALLSIAIRTWFALRWYGFQTGDDLEIAEEAFRVANGLLHQPWNIRNLFVPDVIVAPFVKIALACGVDAPLQLAFFARIPFLLLGALNLALLFLLGKRWYDERTAAIATSLYAFSWIPLVYGSSSYPRTFAVTCILAAALLLDRWPFIAGALAALAVTTRYSEAIFIASLLLLVRNRRSAVTLLAGFTAGIVVFLGLYDRWTWGQWFASAIEFAQLTFRERDASSLNVRQPAWWYFTSLPQWMPLTALPLLVVAATRGERRRALAWIAVPLLVLSAIFHKELRYLQVIVPFAFLLAAAGFTKWPYRRAVAIVLLVLSFPLALGRISSVTRRSTNAVDAALWIAQQKPSGVAISQAWAYGGRLFLGNDISMADIDIPPDANRIRELPPHVTMLALYTSEIDDRVLRESGFVKARAFENRGGRSVTIFRR